MADFGTRLQRLRTARGLSQVELARPGLSASYISLLESGRRRPTRTAAACLAEALDVPVEELLADEPPHERHRLDLAFAQLTLRNGDPVAAAAALEQLLDGLDTSDPDRWTVEHALAEARERAGDLDGAVELLEQLHRRGRHEPARWPWLQVVIDLARCYAECGDLSRAVDLAERAVEDARDLGLSRAVEFPRLVATLAGLCRERGDLVYGSELLTSLLAELGESGTRHARGSALWNAAILAADRGRTADAVLLAERALALFAEQDDTRADSALRVTLAWALLECDPPDAARALALLDQAHARLSEAGAQVDLAYAETELSRAHLLLGAPQTAVDWARSALDRLDGESWLESARARVALARALHAVGDAATAGQQLAVAASTLERSAAGRQAAAVWRELADVHAERGDVDLAGTCWQLALDSVGVRGRVVPALSER